MLIQSVMIRSFIASPGRTNRLAFLNQPSTLALVCLVIVSGCATPHQDDSHHGHDQGASAVEPPRNPRDAISAPNDVDGYTGAGWLLMNRGEIDDALALVREGLEHNPDAFQLHCVLGQIHFHRASTDADGSLDHPSPRSLESIQESLRAYSRAADLGFEERRRTLDTTWTEYKLTDLRSAARMVVLIGLRFGDPQQAMTSGRQFLAELGDDPVIERQLEPPEAP